MQTRRPSTPPPALPSSPPSTLSHNFEDSQRSDPFQEHSPSQDQWTSPAHTLGHSSPELPPLPWLPAIGGAPRTPSAPPVLKESGTYYTTSWGSPYRQPSPGTAHNGQEAGAFGSDDLGSNSSEIEFGLDHLLPSRVPDEESPDFGLEYLLPALVPAAQLTPTTEHFATLAALQELTPRPLSKEAFSHFLAESGEGPSQELLRRFIVAQSEPLLSASDDHTAEVDNTAIQHVEAGDSPETTRTKGKGHKKNLTLKQGDFWTHFREDHQESLAKMMSSRYAPKPQQPVEPSSIVKPKTVSPPPTEKPLPAHPQEALAAEQPASTSKSPSPIDKPLPAQPDAAKAFESHQIIPSLPDEKPTTSIPADTPLPLSPSPTKREPKTRDAEERAPTPPSKRVRKMLRTTKGRGVWVNLSQDTKRGEPGYPPKPLLPSEVQARLDAFEEAGYDTRGFSHWRNAEDALLQPTSYLQNCDVFPDPTDHVEPMSRKQFKVSIPNEQDWKDYQDFLLEQKLAALGVSVGGSDTASQSPAVMSRQGSSQYPPLPFSPPIPTSSASSQRLGQNGSILSGSFGRGPSPGHQSNRSVASPMSAFGNPRGGLSHMHRHSTFTSSSNYAPQPTPPGMSAFSPQQYFGSHTAARGGSPAASSAVSIPNLNDVMSPGSPFNFTPQAYTFPQKEDFLAQMQQTRLQSPRVGSIRPASTLEEVPEDEAEEDIPEPQQVKQADTVIAIPKPRGHQHNISENLERDVESADYHLEATFEKDVESGGQFSPGNRFGLDSPMPNKNTTAKDNIPEWRRPRPVEQVLHQPQPHTRAHSLTQPQRKPSLGYNAPVQDATAEASDDAKTDVSEYTNPSLEGKVSGPKETPRLHSTATSQGSNAWKPGHGNNASKNSVGSSLNAGAKEFKFNPAASFKPGSFSFNSLGFEFQPSKPNPFSQSLPIGSRPPLSSSKPSTSTWNVAAPSFTPSASAFTGDFSFASKGPSFKPDASSAQPTTSTQALIEKSANTGSSNVKSDIFGPINFSHKDIIKPATRSKAVPIIRPDVPSRNSPEVEEQKEDADGRPVQSDARMKRARRSDVDGDSVPQFAMPTHPLTEQTQFQASKQEPQVERSPVPDAKENLAPSKPFDGGKPALKQLFPATEDLSAKVSDPEKVSGSRSATPVAPGAEEDNDTTLETMEARVEKSPERPGSAHASKSSLSAAAKEFTPTFGSGSGFEFGMHVTKPSEIIDIDNAPAFPVIPPGRQVSRSPATTFRPSDDGSYKTALSGRRRRLPHADNDSVDYDSFAQPSFNEIDEVMKHMNEEGSDFGVERDDVTSWERSSHPPGSLDFDAATLRPNFHLRSDAPSPSPRRLRPVLRHEGSTEVTQDPFSDSRAGIAYESPVHRLNHAEDVAISDWDDMISEDGNAEKLRSRVGFFDPHVDELIDSVLSTRLGPLENTLRHVQESLVDMTKRTGRSGRRSYSTEPLGSDADDEDDEMDDQRFRNRSPMKDRKFEKIRSIVVDALTSQQQLTSSDTAAPVMPLDLSDIHHALADIKVSLAEQRAEAPNMANSKSTASDIAKIDQTIAELKTSLVEQQRQYQIEALAVKPPTADYTEIHLAISDLKASLDEQQKQQQVRAEAEAAKTAAPVSVDLTEFYQSLSDFKLSLVERQSQQDSQPRSPALPSAETKELYETITDLKSSLADHLQSKRTSSEETREKQDFDLTEIYQALAAMKVQLAHSASTDVQLEDFKDIMEEALQRQATIANEKSAVVQQTIKEALEKQDETLRKGSDEYKTTMEQVITSHASATTQAKDDLRDLIEEAFSRQELKTVKKQESATILENQGRIADLEAMIKEASVNFDQEREAREALEKREAEAQRLLRLNDEEISLMRDSLRDEESKSHALREELQLARSEIEERGEAHDILRTKFGTMEEQNEALELTIDEYRISREKWREENAQSHAEKEQLQKINDSVQSQVHEAVRVRENMRGKIEKLQYDMTQAAGAIAEEKASWQKKDEEHRTRYEVLRARIEAEARTRERLERELERLETQEREGMRLRVKLEHAEQQSAKLEESFEKLKEDRDEQERTAARYEREFREARHTGQTEVQRTRRLMEADIQTATNEINVLRTNSEREKERLQAEIDHVKLEFDHSKARHELQLEEASEIRRSALNEAYTLKEAALEEVKERHERIIEEIRKQHTRALENVREDSRHEETNLKERLSLSDSKVEHFQDKSAHLQDKVEHLQAQLKVARDAANAAALAAQSAKSPAATQDSGVRSGQPEKVSPQALRESIIVLQEQLQERETQIESLEQQISEVDTDAPNKLKERETEVGWLRELLGVRVDDISELINALGQPNFNSEAVRDAAIRIRTNLQMEQQEKERLVSGSGNSFPALTTLSNLATPKATQLANAWSNWRKGRDSRAGSTASVPQILSAPQQSSRSFTPSRPKPSPSPAYQHPGQSLLSGLMTPPASNMRRVSQPHPQTLPKQSRHQLVDQYPEQPSAFASTGRRFSGLNSKQAGKQPLQNPSTPPLFGQSSYDMDPELRDDEFSTNGFYDDDSTVDGVTLEQELAAEVEEEERGWEYAPAPGLRG